MNASYISEEIESKYTGYTSRTFPFSDRTEHVLIHEKVAHILDTGVNSVEYQPIVNIQNNTIFAYEALARFSIDDTEYSPDDIFGLCMGNRRVIFLLEHMLKTYQIRNRPKGETLFLNMDARTFSSEECRGHWAELFEGEKNIVIEIIENDGQKSLVDTDVLIDFLNEQKITYALDDFFQEHTLFSSRILIDAPIIKIDKDFFGHIRKDEAYAEFFKGFIAFCRMQNKSLVVEGIETQEDLELAKQLDIIYVQGFYYRDKFINR